MPLISIYGPMHEVFVYASDLSEKCVHFSVRCTKRGKLVAGLRETGSERGAVGSDDAAACAMDSWTHARDFPPVAAGPVG